MTNDYFKFYYKYDYKYRLLLCLLSNWYSKNCAKNKINSKVVVVSSSMSNLTREHDIILKTIKNFTVEDLIILKKFTSRYATRLQDMFKNIENNGISYDRIIKEIKQDYSTTDKCTCYDEYLYVSKKNEEDKNIIFIRNWRLAEVCDKYMVRNIFITDTYTMHQLTSTRCDGLIEGLKSFVNSYNRTRDIINNISHIDLDEDKNYCLNIYLEGNINTITYLENEMSKDE